MRAPLHNEIQHASKIWHIQDMTYIPHYTTIYRIPIWYLVKCLIWYMLYEHAFNGARATKMQVYNSSCLLTQLIYVWQYCACSMKIYEHARRGEQDKWSPLINTCYVLFLAVCWVLLCTPVVRMQPHQLPVGETSNNLERAALSTGKRRNHKKPSRYTTNQISGLLCRIISDEILLRLAAEGQIASADRRKSDTCSRPGIDGTWGQEDMSPCLFYFRWAY